MHTGPTPLAPYRLSISTPVDSFSAVLGSQRGTHAHLRLDPQLEAARKQAWAALEPIAAELTPAYRELWSDLDLEFESEPLIERLRRETAEAVAATALAKPGHNDLFLDSYTRIHFGQALYDATNVTVAHEPERALAALLGDLYPPLKQAANKAGIDPLISYWPDVLGRWHRARFSAGGRTDRRAAALAGARNVAVNLITTRIDQASS